MPRFDDGPSFDPGSAVDRAAQMFGRWAGDAVVDEERRTVEVASLLMELVDVVDTVPFHAYCEWRRSGGQADASKLEDWQRARDDVVGRARDLLGGIV